MSEIYSNGEVWKQQEANEESVNTTDSLQVVLQEIFFLKESDLSQPLGINILFKWENIVR